MHISEGVLAGPVLVSGLTIAVAATAVGLKKLDQDRIPQAGVLSAAFFVASLVHVPIGPSNVHLILSGLLGLMLGWAAFPAILTGLTLQAVFFQFGGVTTLGVNTVIMAGPAVLCYYLFGKMVHAKPSIAMFGAFACGFLSVFLSSILMGLALVFTEKNFLETAAMVIAANVPIMIVEGLITASCVAFLKKVQPAILRAGSAA